METRSQQPARKFTYGDYRLWPSDQRWELIDGEAYDMSPAPTRSHQALVGEVFRQIANHLKDRACEVYVAPFDVRLPLADEADDCITTVVQPDIAVICDPAKLDEAGCRGAPDWIIEVLSPGTAPKDQILKRDIYQRHGVREYWLVHPTDHILTRYCLDDGHFGPASIEEMQGRTAVGILPGFSIDWDFLAAVAASG